MKKINCYISTVFLLATISTISYAENMRPYLSANAALKGIQACQTLAKTKGWDMAIVIVD